MPTSNTILVVDDDAGIRQTLADLLEEEGYSVATAVDGIDALDQVLATPPRLILLDISMPRMDGFAFTRELELRGLRAATQVIVMTADARAPQKAELAGAEAFLAKPFDIPELLQQVERLLPSA